MLMALLAILLGLAVLVWSADRFVDGASATAVHLGMPPLLIGMVIVGFGTSAPEMVVSAIAAGQGNPGLALGNGYGSNIANIALILGLVAVISPISVHSQIVRKELPILIGVTLVAAALLWDDALTRWDAFIMLAVFAGIMTWSIREGLRQRADALNVEFSDELTKPTMTLKRALTWLVVGLLLLIASSRVLVWGAVEIAHDLGVSDLVIGLTIVAVGTSLPELASSLVATRKGEHDIALGNVIGSNLFNTLAVVGIAAAIHPLQVEPVVLYRDWTVMAVLTVGLFAMCRGFGSPGRITRREGGVLLSIFVGYTGFLIYGVVAGSA